MGSQESSAPGEVRRGALVYKELCPGRKDNPGASPWDLGGCSWEDRPRQLGVLRGNALAPERFFLEALASQEKPPCDSTLLGVPFAAPRRDVKKLET